MTLTHTEIITVAMPVISDEARQRMRARVMAAVGTELDRHQYEQWRDQHLLLLRWQHQEIQKYSPHAVYQSFPDFCREKWDEQP